MRINSPNTTKQKCIHSNIASINRATNIGLLMLWTGTTLLTGYMIFCWQNDSDNMVFNIRNTKNLFIDDMLLSAKDLELENSASLINITLYSGAAATTNKRLPSASQQIESSRKIIYDKILKQKIYKAQKNNPDGFDIKPLPE